MEYKLELFYYDFCPFCLKVKKVIKKMGIKINKCNTMENPECEKRLVQDTGRRTVPCLYINGNPMHESDDIIEWLIEHQGQLEKK